MMQNFFHPLEKYILTSRKIYPKELVLKVEYQGKQVTFLDQNISIKDSIFVCKLLAK